ncbi:MAG: N-acetyl-alpha-D-glucosaminyl L-malate synthase BshA [Cytophagaceae bacterium]|nr:N-acetyl-alpha-D-glucosaminyl L-malate synthase BshA [Cytophagaceae bacterium]|tara:strand:+ start:3198 stop:4343 length:1146 start_codon:yes stop_codon:yes gene_type:complete
MKIAIVCYPTFGGSGVVATELGIALAKRGHEVHFITYRQPVRLDLLMERVFFHEVNVPDYPLFHYQPYELALSSKLVNIIKAYHIDLLHVHYAIPHAYAGYMAKKMLQQEGMNIPMVTTLHGTDITLVGNHPFYKPAVTFSINKSDYVTSVSKSLKEDTLRLFTIKRDINVIPNFIEQGNIKEGFTDCQRDLMAQPHERIITHISNMRAVKCIPDVIKVFAKIQEEIPAKLIMVGEGPEREPGENLCDELGIGKKVVWLGNSNEIDKILCFSDLFLLPSRAESFGLAALEAMAHGVPVVSSNAGGLSEVNVNGISGYLSDIGDVDTMATNALSILTEDSTLQRFKEQARAEAKKFDIDYIVPMYEEIYEKALGKSQKKARA